MDYMLFDGYLELLNAHCQPPSFQFDKADGEFRLEPPLHIRCETMNLSLQLTHNEVRISHTPGGGFSLSIA